MRKLLLAPKSPRADLMGGCDVALQSDAVTSTLLMKTYYPHPVELTIYPRIQRHLGYEPGGLSRQTGATMLSPVTIRVVTLTTDKRAVQKQSILGSSQLFVGEAVIPLPQIPLCRDSVFEIEITSQPLTMAVAVGETSGRDEDPQKHFRIEVSRRQLVAHRRGGWTAFWLLTRSQAERRLMEVAHDHGLFDRDDDETIDTLTKLTFAIYSGLDSPVLTERLLRSYERTCHV